MMWLLNQWAERNILAAQRDGEFNNLAGSGKPLQLDDDAHVPQELRVAYRLLKNAGCLPVELEQRKEALELTDLLKSVRTDDPQFSEITRRLALLELKLGQAGVSTSFLHRDYAINLSKKFHEE